MKIIAKASTEKFSVKENDYKYDRWECAICYIRYTVPRGGVTSCPLCRAREENSELVSIQSHMSMDIERAEHRIESISIALDHLVAMQVAVETMDEEDLERLKELTTIVRENDLDLNGYATIGIMFRKASESPVGLLLHRFNKDQMEVRFGSVGGIALASAFMMAKRVHGDKKATEMLLASVPYESEWDTYVD